MAIRTTDSVSYQVTATDGKTLLTTLQCSYTCGKGVNVSMMLTDAYNAEEHMDLVSDALRYFESDVIERLICEGMPIPAKG